MYTKGQTGVLLPRESGKMKKGQKRYDWGGYDQVRVWVLYGSQENPVRWRTSTPGWKAWVCAENEYQAITLCRQGAWAVSPYDPMGVHMMMQLGQSPAFRYFTGLHGDHNPGYSEGQHIKFVIPLMKKVRAMGRPVVS